MLRLLGTIILLLNSSAWGQESTSSVTFFQGFFSQVRSNECLRTTWVSNLLDYVNNPEIKACLQDEERGNIGGIIDFVDNLAPEDPTVERLCQNLRKVLHCYVPEDEKCKEVANKLETVYNKIMCGGNTGENYPSVQSALQAGKEYLSCSLKMMHYGEDLEARECLAKGIEDLDSDDKNQQLCEYATTLRTCAKKYGKDTCADFATRPERQLMEIAGSVRDSYCKAGACLGNEINIALLVALTFSLFSITYFNASGSSSQD